MRGIVAIAVAVGALLVLPALCISGLIIHPCECADALEGKCEAGCAHEPDGGHESHGDHESGCGHESECSDDPCTNLFVRYERLGDDFDAAPDAAAPCFVSDLTSAQRGTQVARRENVCWPDSRTLPIPISDVPLLI